MHASSIPISQPMGGLQGFTLHSGLGRMPLVMGQASHIDRYTDVNNGDLRAKREKTTSAQQAAQAQAQAKKAPSASKRGEYRCGKCGFFPKKEKHNCATERVRRQASGDFIPGDKGGSKSKSLLSSRPGQTQAQLDMSNSISGTMVPPRSHGYASGSDPMLPSFSGGW